MTLPDKTRQNTLFLTSIVLCISWIIGYFYLEYQFELSVKEQYQEQYSSVKKFFQINLKHEKQKLKLELEKIVLLKGLSEAVHNNNNEKLDTIITPYYTEFKKLHSDIQTLIFRSSDGTILYLKDDKKNHNTQENEKRKLLLETDKLQKSLSGFEIIDLDMTYRMTQAIFDNGRYVGSVEIGLDPMHFMNNMSKVFTMQIGIAIDNALLKREVSSSVVVKDNYILVKSDEKFKQFFINSNKFNIDIFNIDSDIKVQMDIPLKNYASEVLGYLVVGCDMSGIIAQKKEFIYRLLFLMVVISLVIGYVLHKGFEKMLKYFTKQVYTDQLTGLKNRAALNDILSSNKGCILVLSDIKDFSIINELYGVEIGNEVLVEFANFFYEFASKYRCQSFRISSDEFVMLRQDECSQSLKYNEILDELHASVKLLNIKIMSINETIKIDIHSGITFDHMYSLEEAQMALKKAKENSLPYLAYSKQVDTKKRAENLIQTKHLIRNALECYNVIPFFQPITDGDGKFIKYEALVRIIEVEEGKKKILYPDLFLDISKKNGLYVDIAKRMIRQSLLFFALRDEKISINLYPSDLYDTSIIDTIIESMEKFDLPGRVVIEILEQENLGDIDRVLDAVNKLKAIGIQIAIDDFGSGYSNYAHILKLKPDYLKIDASLIKDIIKDEESRILVKSIVSFAKDLNIITVAEYVENKEIFELLKEYGVDEFQGYYFSKPMDLLNAH